MKFSLYNSWRFLECNLLGKISYKHYTVQAVAEKKSVVENMQNRNENFIFNKQKPILY